MTFRLELFFATGEYSLRSAVESDTDELVGIINDAYVYQDEVRGVPRTNLDHLSKRISETDFYVIQHRKSIVGCVYLESHVASLHFGLLTLASRYRGMGIAAQIIDAIEDLARTNNFEAIELDYMSVAPWLKPYYQRYGFEETGLVESWGKIQLIRMKKDL